MGQLFRDNLDMTTKRPSFVLAEAQPFGAVISRLLNSPQYFLRHYRRAPTFWGSYFETKFLQFPYLSIILQSPNLLGQLFRDFLPFFLLPFFFAEPQPFGAVISRPHWPNQLENHLHAEPQPLGAVISRL